MRVGVRSVLAARKICVAVLLGAATIALVIPGKDVAFSQSSTDSRIHLYTAIDLNASGFTMTEALGVSGLQQVGSASKTSQWEWEHALLWHGSAASVVDLIPNHENAKATAICGDQQVGYADGFGTAGTRGDRHALLWRSSSDSVVDLHPHGFEDSEATGTSGGEQVGSGIPAGGGSHALLWRGSASSVVDLHPHGFENSEATGTSGGEQVGWGFGPATGNVSHALLWRGSAGSVVDLHPAGFGDSEATGTSGGEQVGWGRPIGSQDFHALLWRGSAASVVDLTPRGVLSEANATNGEEQVGIAGGHAVLWRRSAASMVDLHVFLPPGFESSSASGIDAVGDIVGAAETGHWQPTHAILWKRNVPRLGTSRERNSMPC